MIASGSDPLRGGTPVKIANPLTNDAEENVSVVILESENENTGFEEWTYKRPRILKKYTTNAAIPVSANFLEDKVMQGIRL